MSKESAVAFLTGYIRGLWRHYEIKPDDKVLSALATLGAKPMQLRDEKKTKPRGMG